VQGSTHVAVGIVTGAAIAAHFHVVVGGPLLVILSAAALSALLPDIDHPASRISRALGLAALPFRLLAHRGLTHSLLAVVGLALLLAGVHTPFIYAAATVAGYSSHLLADALTPIGIRLVYPLRWHFRLVPRSLAISTGGALDGLLGVFSLLASIYLLNHLS